MQMRWSAIEMGWARSPVELKGATGTLTYLVALHVTLPDILPILYALLLPI